MPGCIVPGVPNWGLIRVRGGYGEIEELLGRKNDLRDYKRMMTTFRNASNNCRQSFWRRARTAPPCALRGGWSLVFQIVTPPTTRPLVANDGFSDSAQGVYA